MIVDVDSHWEVEHFADGEYPLEAVAGPFPGHRLEQIAYGVAGDLLLLAARRSTACARGAVARG